MFKIYSYALNKIMYIIQNIPPEMHMVLIKCERFLIQLGNKFSHLNLNFFCLFN